MSIQTILDSADNKGAAFAAGNEKWVFRLYVAGQSTRSVMAMSNIRKICSEHLEGLYELEIIDLLASPQLAEQDQIIAVPTLVRKHPMPPRRLIGDLSDTVKALAGLDITSRT